MAEMVLERGRKMTNRQLTFGLAAIFAAIIVAGIIAYVSVVRYQSAIKVNAQTEIERTRIQEDAKLERTRERMNVIPWYKGGSNKDGK